MLLRVMINGLSCRKAFLKLSSCLPLLVVIASCGTAVAQSSSNLAYFDRDVMHYGIQVGYSQSKFDIDFTKDPDLRQQALDVRSYYTAGFHISIIADLRLGEFFNLRTLPGILLLTRDLNYSWTEDFAKSNPLIENKRSVESVYGEIPLELKFRAHRYQNFRPYVTAGGGYSFDFSSLRKNKNNNNESIIRLGANNICYSLGVGCDFFLHYVKFAIDLKFSFGTVDLKVPDDEAYTLIIDKMKTRTVMLSFTFEG